LPENVAAEPIASTIPDTPSRTWETFQMPETSPLPATLQSTLGLNRTEIELLLRLVAWGSLAREQIPAIATCGHRSVKLSSVNAIVRGLRKKLAAHDIELVTLREFGWGLRPEGREKIVALIGPRQAPGVNTEAAGAKSRQESRMSPEGRQTHPAAA
jgi:hypothetical protein